MEYDTSCWDFVDVLFQADKVPLQSHFAEKPHHERVLGFVKHLFLHLLMPSHSFSSLACCCDGVWTLSQPSTPGVNPTGLWHVFTSHIVRFSVCSHFVKDCCIYVYQGSWSVVSLSCTVWFWYQLMLASSSELRSAHSAAVLLSQSVGPAPLPFLLVEFLPEFSLLSEKSSPLTSPAPPTSKVLWCLCCGLAGQ